MTNHDRAPMSPARRRMTNALRRSLLSLAAAGLASAAGAATVKVTFDNPIFNGSGHDQVKISFPKPSPQSGSITLSNVGAGRFQGAATDLVGIEPGVFVDSVDDLYMYCYDVYESIRGGATVTYTVRLDGERDRTLDFLGAVNAVMNRGRPNDDPYAWLHPADRYQGAAIQLGIWESRYEASPAWDIADGTFRASGFLKGKSNMPKTAEWLAGFFGAIDSSDALDGRFAMTLEASGAQDMITGDPPPADVPVPGTLALVGLALVGLRSVRRRRAGA